MGALMVSIMQSVADFGQPVEKVGLSLTFRSPPIPCVVRHPRKKVSNHGTLRSPGARGILFLPRGKVGYHGRITPC